MLMADGGRSLTPAMLGLTVAVGDHPGRLAFVRLVPRDCHAAQEHLFDFRRLRPRSLPLRPDRCCRDPGPRVAIKFSGHVDATAPPGCLVSLHHRRRQVDLGWGQGVRAARPGGTERVKAGAATPRLPGPVIRLRRSCVYSVWVIGECGSSIGRTTHGHSGLFAAGVGSSCRDGMGGMMSGRRVHGGAMAGVSAMLGAGG